MDGLLWKALSDLLSTVRVEVSVLGKSYVIHGNIFVPGLWYYYKAFLVDDPPFLPSCTSDAAITAATI